MGQEACIPEQWSHSGSAPTDALQWAGALCLQSVLRLDAAPFIFVVYRWLLGTKFSDKLAQERRPVEGGYQWFYCPLTFYPKSFQICVLEATVTPVIPAGHSSQGVNSTHEIQSQCCCEYTARASEFLRSPHIMGTTGSESPLVDPHQPTPGEASGSPIWSLLPAFCLSHFSEV